METKLFARNSRLALGLLAIFCLICTSAAAVWAGECEERIQIVRADVGTVTLYTPYPETTRERLAAKLDAAIAKLGEPKNEDAKQKLEDFKYAVEAMRDARKKKVGKDDASLLLDGASLPRSAYDEGVNGAIVCISLLP